MQYSGIPLFPNLHFSTMGITLSSAISVSIVVFATLIGDVSSTSLSLSLSVPTCMKPTANSACTPTSLGGDLFKECGLYKQGESCPTFCSYLMTKTLRCHNPDIPFLLYRRLYGKCNYDCEKRKEKLENSRLSHAKIYVTNMVTIAKPNCYFCNNCHLWKCPFGCYTSCYW